jgi:3-oxoacyl-[acyl-carrier-protein] synthase-3
MRNARMLSVGAFAPEKVVPNSYFNELLGEDVDSWLQENVQIYERRWCSEEESTADLCVNAARQALERAGISAGQLDLLIVATDTPEYISPSTAAVVQYRLGAKKAGAFDVNTACAGFATALDMGAKYLMADAQYEYVLIIGAYAMSKYLNLQDKKTVTLFADGAGAVLLGVEKADSPGFLGSQLITEGQYHDYMGIYAGGTRYPINEQRLSQKEHLLRFVHKFPKELNPERWTGMVHTLCHRLDIQAGDIDHFFITQININSIWETMDLLGVDRRKAHTVMHHYGYTGSACIPMALNDAWEKGKIQRGDLIFFIGSGGGLAFAAAAFRF